MGFEKISKIKILTGRPPGFENVQTQFLIAPGWFRPGTNLESLKIGFVIITNPGGRPS